MNSICWPECHELTWCYSYLCLLRYDTCTFMNCAHDRNSCTDPWSMHTWHDHTQFTCPCTRTVHTTFQSFQKKAAPYGWIVDPKELGVYHFGILYYWTPESRHWPSQQHLVSWGLLFPKWGASSYTCYWCTVCKSRGERGGIDFFYIIKRPDNQECMYHISHWCSNLKPRTCTSQYTAAYCIGDMHMQQNFN